MKNNKIVDKGFVEDKIMMIYLPVIVQVLALLLFFSASNFLIKFKWGVSLIIIMVIVIALLVFYLCFCAFKNFMQLVKAHYISFISLFGILINSILVVFNCCILYFLIIGLIN